MDKLIVLTFSDKPLTDDNHLKKTCEEQGLNLKVLIHSPWEFNAIKIKLLYEWLPDVDPDSIILATDAFDVAIYDDASTIVRKYQEIEGDIIFSAESNFYFRNKKLVKQYWKEYPRQTTIYDYLNSGTYVGKAGYLINMIESMVEKGDITLEAESLRATRSDQYAFSKHYVDYFHAEQGPKIRLDHEQKLMGCSGGRFSVIPFPDLSKMQAFLFFLVERNLLKTLKLHSNQNQPKDFKVEKNRFYNKKTKQFPSIIHLPGTWDNFDVVIERLLNQRNPISKNPIALLVSILSFVLSLIFGIFLFFPKRRD